MLNYEFPPLGGGASPVSYEIAKGYVDLGHSVDVVTMGFKGLPMFEVVEGINVYRVPCKRKKKEICTTSEMFTYVTGAKKFLRKFLKKRQYDINHTHFIIPTGVVSLWVKKKFGIKYVLTSHGSDVLGYNKRFSLLYPFLVTLWKKIIREAEEVITPSMFLQRKIKGITIEGKFKVVPNPVDEKWFIPMKKEKYLLCVSRLFINKGIQDLLKALEGLDLKGWRVKIVGDGPYKKELLKLRKKYKLENDVEFLGWIDNRSEKMRELYGKASIFILPSYFENYSAVLTEAKAAGCKVLASNVGGNPEIIKDKKNLFAVGNVNEIKMVLSKLMN